MRSFNEPILNAADASVNQNSIIVDAQNLHLASLHVTMTGTAAGTVKFQASNDEPRNGTAPSNWVDISGATVSVSAAGQFLIPKLDVCYNFMRAVYTFTSGTGTVTAKMHMIGY
jgi:hypothetical protein